MSQKQIAFYSPMKPIGHPVPSGDRLMARLLVKCLQGVGFRVDVASQMRVFLRDPESESDKTSLTMHADLEIQRLSALWGLQGVPQLWFCYHPYFKSPDLVGPPLCRRFGIPYVTAEASYSRRRGDGIWASTQETVLASVNQAAVNICFTNRDKSGLRKASPEAVLATLRPFIDTSKLAPEVIHRTPSRLITVAMMRAGDKMNSYIKLAEALKQLLHLPWTLSIVGEGALRDEVHNLFSDIPPERVEWQGLLEQPAIARLLAQSALYVWPGCGEAYGLAYLEAQAAGVPVVAFDTAGVSEVVDHGNSGFLTPDGDVESFAAAVSSLLSNPDMLQHMSENAVSYVQRHHSLKRASSSLQNILQRHLGL